MKRYELLQEGDVIKEGDEYYREKPVGCDAGWFPAGTIGYVISKNSIPHRRPIPDKPKVRLEELIEIVSKHQGVAHLNHAAQSRINMVKEICAHLGVEIEEEKQPWEGELEKFLQEKHIEYETGERGKFVKEIAQAMFQAGQACERRKGEK